MKKYKKILLSCGAIIVTIGIALGAVCKIKDNIEYKVKNISTNYISYDTVDELDKGAELIVVGETKVPFKDRKHVNVFKGSTLMDYHTLTDLKISKIIKSDNLNLKEGDILKIIEPVTLVKLNGQISQLQDDGYTPLEPSKKYIIFLAKNTDNQYGVINMYRGKFEIGNKSSIIKSSTDKHASEYTKFKDSVLAKYNSRINYDK